jgi:hypothetical protein
MSILTEVEPEWYVTRKVTAVPLDVQLCDRLLGQENEPRGAA